MKTSTLILVAVLALVLIGISLAGWDNVPVPQAAKDIIDLLAPVPANISKEYGNTEKVRVIHDILVLKAEINKIFAARDARILALEDRIKVLEAKVEALTSEPTVLDLHAETTPVFDALPNDNRPEPEKPDGQASQE